MDGGKSAARKLDIRVGNKSRRAKPESAATGCAQNCAVCPRRRKLRNGRAPLRKQNIGIDGQTCGSATHGFGKLGNQRPNRRTHRALRRTLDPSHEPRIGYQSGNLHLTVCGSSARGPELAFDRQSGHARRTRPARRRRQCRCTARIFGIALECHPPIHIGKQYARVLHALRLHHGAAPPTVEGRVQRAIERYVRPGECHIGAPHIVRTNRTFHERFAVANDNVDKGCHAVGVASRQSEQRRNRRDLPGKTICQIAFAIDSRPDASPGAIDPQPCIGHVDVEIGQRKRRLAIAFGQQLVDLTEAQPAVDDPPAQPYTARADCPRPDTTKTR